MTSTLTTDLPVNQVDRFRVLGVLARSWQVLIERVFGDCRKDLQRIDIRYEQFLFSLQPFLLLQDGYSGHREQSVPGSSTINLFGRIPID